LVAFSALRLDRSLRKLLVQSVDRGLRSTLRHGVLGGSGLFEPWKFRKQFEHARFGAVYCRFEKCESEGVGGEEDK
jgi:hypothetical protein